MTTERDELLSYISDAYKDVHGFRPSGVTFLDLTVPELQKEADRLSNAVEESISRDNDDHARCAEKFEEDIAKIQADHSISWDEAVKKHAIDTDNYYFGDWGYTEHCFGLEYGYIEKKINA